MNNFKSIAAEKSESVGKKCREEISCLCEVLQFLS